MTRAIIVLFSACVLVSCTQRMVCPAYQSAFIYDKDELRKKFSYFSGDTTPKMQYAASSKNRYLVVEPISYRAKIRSMRTVEMKPVMVNVPDSISGKGAADSVSMADLDRAARSVIDSTFIVDIPKKDTVAEPLDSIYVITKDKEVRVLKYNTPDSLEYDPITQRYIPQKPKYVVTEVRYNKEQDHYMWYLRDVLVLPDVRLAKMQGTGGKEGSGREARKRQGIKGFFKNLFRKKKKEEVDSTALPPPPQEEEFDFIDADDTVSRAEIPQPGQPVDKPKKKGLFGNKDKKPKVKKEKKPKKKEEDEALPPEEKDKKKKEDEDDGF